MNSFEPLRERPWRCSLGLRIVGLSYVILAYFVSCPFLSFWTWSWNYIKCWLLVGYQLVLSLRANLSSNVVIVSWFYWKLSDLIQSPVQFWLYHSLPSSVWMDSCIIVPSSRKYASHHHFNP
jgi:hypothetical protein